MSNTEESDTRTLQEQTLSENGSDAGRKDHKRAETVAVAIEYDAEGEYAPKVVAEGRGKIAEQILQIAFDRGIKVRKDADLAEMLSAIDIDSEIPVSAFAAVAEILTYVYRANGNMPDFIKEEMQKEHEKYEQNQESNVNDEPEGTP